MKPAQVAPSPATSGQTPAASSQAVAQVALVKAPSSRNSYYGLGLDLGVSGILPDAGLLLTLRPWRWLHLQLGPGYNGLSPAIRGGATIVNPYFVPLSLTWEGGHYFEGDANKAVRWFRDGTQDIASLRRFSYDYMNVLGGRTVGGRHFCFYIRAGVTWMRATVKDFQQSVHDIAQVDLQASDPKVGYRGPTAKIGMLFFP